MDIKQQDIDVIGALWGHKWLVIGLTTAFAVLSIVLALSMTSIYRSEALLAPVSTDTASSGGLSGLAGQFGGLASLTGISLGGVKTDKTLLAMEFLRSRTFLIDFIQRHDLKVTLMAAKGWDRKNNNLIIDPDVYDEQGQSWVRVVEFPKQPEPSGWEAYEVLLEQLTVERDSKNGLVSLSIEHYSPYVAQKLADLLISDLNNFMRERDMVEAQSSIAFLQKQIDTTSIVGMQEALYDLIEEQLKITMLAEVREEYAFSYVDPPVVPEQKYKPRRAVIVIVGTFAGGLLSCILALFIVLARRPRPNS